MKRGLVVVSLFILLGVTVFVSALNCGSYSYMSPTTAQASSVQSYYSVYSASNAIDDNPSTMWFGEKTETWEGNSKWIEVGLGEEKCVDGVKMMVWFKDDPLTFNIDVYNSQDGWTTVAQDLVIDDSSVTTGNIVREFNFSEVYASRVRINETSGVESRAYGTLTDIYVSAAEKATECTEHWTCTSWSSCVNDEQTRTCTDSNSCGTAEDKPIEVRVCNASEECVSDEDCAPSEVCDTNQCVDSCSVVNCEAGYTCVDGECVFEGECVTNEDCEGYGEICIDNECVYRTCTDSDGGMNYFVNGTTCQDNDCKEDYCITSTELFEMDCGESGRIRTEHTYTCPNGCQDKACIRDSQTCQDLIEKVTSPTNFIDHGVEYTRNWHYQWSESDHWMINGQRYSAAEYTAGWFTNYEGEWHSIHYNIVVFNDSSVDLQSYLEDRTAYEVCQATTYFGANEVENIVYICNWDLIKNNQNLDNGQYKSRQVLWTNNNLLIQVNTYSNKWLSDEEIENISKKRFNEFLGDLRDNRYNYADWSDFDIDWPLSRQIKLALAQCPSDVPAQDCSPCWECKTEPIICPPHGEQTKRCVDNCCDGGEREEVDYCSPGVCSGCYIPKWFGKKWSSSSRCIPYGFRFENPTSWDDDVLGITEEDLLLKPGSSEDYTLEILSDSMAVLILYSDEDGTAYEYTLSPRETVMLNIPDWENDVDEVTITVNDIVYGEGTENYVGVTFNAIGWERYSSMMNAYCDIDGQIKRQKTVDASGDWAKCQNNYECESNVCSSGECIEVHKMIEEGSAFKEFIIRLLCRILNPINNSDYESCVNNYLGG